MRWIVVALFATTAHPAIPLTYSQIAPILQKHCVSCHAAGGIGPMPLTTYKEARPWAKAIRESVKLRRMPPWFADPAHGEFANDPRLTENEIRAIDTWTSSGAPPGRAPGTPPNPQITLSADITLTAPKPVNIPARATIEYQYLVIPLPFADERWVTAAEIRPSDRSVVHHAVLYVRSPQSNWLRDAPANTPFAPKTREARVHARSTTADILAIYTPGAPAMRCPEGMAKKIPAGADLILQLHYTSKNTRAIDRPGIALTLAKNTPSKRILTLQMGRADLLIPPGEPDYTTSVTGTLPSAALLISMFPHMHLRGSAFEYDIIGSNGHVETLLKVKPYKFDWQLNYILKTPRLLPKGTVLRWTGYFDNSVNNPANPDPTAEVRWGEQSWEEMMIGFFDVAVDPSVDKEAFFSR